MHLFMRIPVLALALLAGFFAGPPAGLGAPQDSAMMGFLLKGQLAQAHQLASRGEDAQAEKRLPQLEALQALQSKALATFQEHEGEEIPVELIDGVHPLRIVQVQATMVSAQKILRVDGRKVASSPRNFTFENLSLRERIKRLAKETSPEADLLRGLLALEADRKDLAAKYLQRSGTPLARELLGSLEQRAAAQQSALAKQKTQTRMQEAHHAYQKLLVMALVSTRDLDDQALVEHIQTTQYEKNQAEQIQRALRSFHVQFGDTPSSTEHAEVLAILGKVRPNQSLTVDRETLDTAWVLFQKANPGVKLPRDLMTEREDGLSLNFRNKELLSDLRPLKDLPVVDLDIFRTRIKDLGPLAHWPLRKLVQRLDLSYMLDFTPLQRLPLEHLELYTHNQPFDLKDFRSLPLRVLILGNDWQFPSASLEPLSDLPLEKLVIESSNRANMKTLMRLNGVERMPLRELRISRTHVSNLGPLAGLQTLKVLDISHTKVKDLSPLAGLALEELDITGLKINDVGPLQDMKALKLKR